MLQILHLEHMFLSPELRDFLVAKASTLQKLHLRSCRAEIEDEMVDDGLRWHELFDALSSAEPKKLRDFLISEARPAPLPMDKSDYDKYHSRAEGEDADADADADLMNEQIKEARERVQGSGKRGWPHELLDHHYRLFYEDLEENFLSFREERDQEAYERFLNLVSRNRERGGESG